MCIVLFKPKNKDCPDLKTIENCYDNNSDGAGMMYLDDDNKIVIEKGFMSWGKFKKAYTRKGFTKDSMFILHFRIATHGNIDKHTCHPFPISDKVEMLKKTKLKTDFAMAHNGIIEIKDEDDSISDTMLFVKDILADIPAYHLYNNEAIQTLIKDFTFGSKLILWHTKHGIMMTGTWINEGGIYYSNDSYKEVKFSNIKNWWKDYDAYDYYDSYTRDEKTGKWVKTKKDKKSLKKLNENWLDDVKLLDDEGEKYRPTNCDFCGMEIDEHDDYEIYNDSYVCSRCLMTY